MMLDACVANLRVEMDPNPIRREYRGLLVAFLIGLATCFSSGRTIAQDLSPEQMEESEKQLLSGTRQITFEGRRAGEGYFSSSGTRMVFQSEREIEQILSTKFI